jgi:hypothetical protein
MYLNVHSGIKIKTRLVFTAHATLKKRKYLDR